MHHENILKKIPSQIQPERCKKSCFNEHAMLVITRGLILNGWIKNENMQLKVLELAFTANVVRKKYFFHVEKRSKRPKKYNFRIMTTFIFNEIGHFQSYKMSMKQIQGNCFFGLKKSVK